MGRLSKTTGELVQNLPAAGVLETWEVRGYGVSATIPQRTQYPLNQGIDLKIIILRPYE